MTKEKTLEAIEDEFYGLSFKKQVAILHEALEIMQSNNSQSVTVVIAKAMNYRPVQLNNYTGKWKWGKDD